jgi:hypothetical protein
MDWSVDTKCKSRDDDCKCWDFDVSLRESGGVGHQHLELLLFKRRPRFTSLKIFSRLPRVPFSKKNFWTIQVDLIKPTDDSEIFFGIFISLLAGALCDNSRQYFFTWVGSFVKKIASSGKKTEASNPETTHPPQKFFGIRRRLGTQSELIGSLDRIEHSSKKSHTIRSERRYEVAFSKVRNHKTLFQKNKISKSDARSWARRTISCAKRSTPSVSRSEPLKVQVTLWIKYFC